MKDVENLDMKLYAKRLLKTTMHYGIFLIF